MEGEWEAAPHYAGTSAALVHAVAQVADILSRTEADALAALRRAMPV